MADNLEITEGAGSPIATNDVSGVHYQRMKLVAAGAGETEPYGDDDKGSARALWTVPRPDRRDLRVASASLTIASTAYSANDVVSTGWQFTDFARASGGQGYITGAGVIDEGDQLDGLILWLFSGSVSFGTDNAAPSISDADAIKFCGVIPVGLTDVGGVRLGSVDSIRAPYWCDATTLFVYATTPGATLSFFAANDDVSVTLSAERI